MKEKKDIFENEPFDRKNPFKVPEGYFDSLESRLSVHETGVEESGSRRGYLFPSLVMALSFVLVLGIGTLLMKTFTPGQEGSGLLPEGENTSVASLVMSTSVFDYEYLSEEIYSEDPVEEEPAESGDEMTDEEYILEYLSMNTSFVTAENIEMEE